VEEWVTLPKEVREKLSVKNGDSLQYLLIKNGYVIIKRFGAEEAIRQVEEKSLKSQPS
jgi:bifunctional DNA-binding transcriptional regulator/antitoxin component of YhaV-PrlF toxin-antitoxin module